MKVGNYTIPNLRLFPTLVEATLLIYNTYPNDEITNMEILAKLLGHKSEKSGTFLGKMTCLRAYGLIEGRGSVRVSEIGKKITFGSDEEKGEAIKKAVLSIPLWSELYSKFGVNLPTDTFWVQLAKITNLEAPEAQRVSEQVRKAYLDDIHYLPQEKGEKTSVQNQASQLMQPIAGMESLTIPGGAHVVLPKENMKESWEKLKRTVDAFFKEEV